MSEMTPEVPTRAAVEAVIRRALPGLLVGEYGATETDWRELRSVARIARALADDITTQVGVAP